ncbi:hypothetical protein D3C72_1878180 [compost metagenome]
MQVAGAEPVGDGAVALVEGRFFRADSPAAGETPFVEAWRFNRIGTGRAGTKAFVRGKAGGLPVTDIGLAGADILQVGTRFCAFCLRLDGRSGGYVAAGFS